MLLFYSSVILHLLMKSLKTYNIITSTNSSLFPCFSMQCAAFKLQNQITYLGPPFMDWPHDSLGKLSLPSKSRLQPSWDNHCFPQAQLQLSRQSLMY